MFIYLSKLLPLFVYPTGFACLLILAALLLRRPAWRRATLILALVVLYLGSNSWVALGLARSLEWRYFPPRDLPHASVIVVLGGGTRSASPPRPMAEVGEGGDRVIYAAWLYRQGAAPNILLSGTGVDWLALDLDSTGDMATLIELMGVPPGVLWFDTASQNTHESAVNCRQLLAQKGIQQIILVTSATHMPRSVALFEHEGLQVIPAPTDYIVTQDSFKKLRSGNLAAWLYHLLPSVDNLGITTLALKEYFGIVIYKLQGWI
jgi:uncharacterized SAM-binding protein YcdF (DUF218 family)